MVTRNFLNLLAMYLQSGKDTGALAVRAVTGKYGALAPSYISTLASPTLDPLAYGISIGTGDTPPTEEDYNLEATITSGVTMTLTETASGIDAPGMPYIQFKITVTNTGSDPITVKEIGYKRQASVKLSLGYSSSGGTGNTVLLLDRTVLDTPVTIAAGDAGIITYKLRTIPRAYGTVGGVQIASFEGGTDEQIAAILDAAIAGDLDLQTDAGWHVGDMRVIHLDAWTGGGSAAHPAEDVCIAISSFAEYNECGNILQFDFVGIISGIQRMNATATNTGGYGAMEMYTTTLPALVDALPTWLKSRLKTFSVLAKDPASDTINTVTGNKLALRAASETYGGDQPAEGARVPLYEGGKYTLIKTQTSGSNYWVRTPIGSNDFKCIYTYNSTPWQVSMSQKNASNTQTYLAPFGCI